MPRSTFDGSGQLCARGRSEKQELAAQPVPQAGSTDADVRTQLVRLQPEHVPQQMELERITTRASEYDHQTLLQMVLEQLPSGVVVAESPSGRLLMANRAWYQMWHQDDVIPEDAFAGYKSYDCFHPDGRPYLPHECPLTRVIMKAELVSDEEMIFRRGDGRFRVMQVNAIPVGAGSGHIVAGVAIYTDITQRKEYLAALRESESTIKALFESAAQAILAVSLTGAITMANAAAEKMFGYRREEFSSMTIEQLLPARFHVQHSKMREWFFAHPRDRVMGAGRDLLATRKDGTEFPIEVSLSAFESRAGVQTVAFISDITARWQAEHAIRASEERYRQLSQSVPLLLWSCRDDGTWDYLSRQWVEYTGIAPADHLGHGWLEALHPDGRDQTRQAWRLAVQTGEEFQATHRIRKADGAYRWFKTCAKPMLDDSGQIVKWLGSCTDIDDQIHAEQAVAEKIEALAHSNKMLEQFAYVASHDLQEPLRGISGFVELLGRQYRGKLGPDADEYIAFACNGAKRMQQLIDDLLAFSRIGTRDRQLAPADMNEVLEGSLQALRVSIDECQAVIKRERLPVVLGDRALLAQLFQNLIGNALKYRKRDVPPQIHVWAEPADREWLFSVQDNGIGIDSRYFEKIFEIFQRLQTGPEYSGTGIGLAICQNIVARHQGRIWVDSEVGVGSTFRFTLPVAGG